jgi:transposase-like protein
MSKYSKEKKEHALSLMGPPQNLPVAEVARRTGVTEPTLYAWRNQARAGGRVVPGDGSNASDWKPEDKFAMVVETLGLAEAELAEYCRRKGVYVEQIVQWRTVCMQANSGVVDRTAAAALADERRRSRQLEKELGRKERALAEAAALLVLSRKLEALRNKGEDA